MTVKNPLSLLGERQGAEQDVALTEECQQLLRPGKAVYAGHAMPAARPSRQAEPIRLQRREYLPGL
ncbi:hypothetical protein D3C86_1737110 [compost metagenome]